MPCLKRHVSGEGTTSRRAGHSPLAARHVALAPIVLTAALVCGCVQIEVTVQMLDTGGATVTERARFSADLMALDSTSAPDQRLAPLLERPAVEARAKLLGQGAALVSHEVVDIPGGARESRAVYSIPDIEDLRLPNPYLTQSTAAYPIRLRFSPIYKVVHSFHVLGDMMLEVVPAQAPPAGPKPDPAAAPLTPLQLQPLRDMEPIFVDMAKDLQVTMRLITCERSRYGTAKTVSRTIVLLSFSDQNLDMYNTRFFENEEVMLCLLQWQLDSDTILNHTENYSRNPVVPVLRARRPYASGRFRVTPSNALFKKYFAGRPKSQGGDVDDTAAPAVPPK